MWAFFWKNSLGDKEYFGRLFHIYLYVVALFILITSFKNFSEIKKITILALLLIFSFDTLLNGYQEYIMFALIVFEAKLLFTIINNKKKIYNILFIVNGILICFIKNEGIFYSIFFFIIYFFFNKKKKLPITFGAIIFVIISCQLYISKVIYKLESALQFSFYLIINI